MDTYATQYDAPPSSNATVLAPTVLAPTVLAPTVLAPTVLAPTVLAPTVLAPIALSRSPMSRQPCCEQSPQPIPLDVPHLNHRSFAPNPRLVRTISEHLQLAFKVAHVTEVFVDTGKAQIGHFVEISKVAQHHLANANRRHLRTI
jgi:hypothetical protein